MPRFVPTPAGRVARPLTWALAAVLTTGALAGCSHHSGSAAGETPSVTASPGHSSSGSSASAGSASGSASASNGPQVAIAANVPDGSTLGLTQPITVSAQGGTPTGITVVDASGAPVAGTYNPQAQAWTPQGMLKKGASYTVTASVKSTAGAASTSSRTVQAASTGASTTGIYTVTPYTFSDVGNAQPVVLTFSQAVPTAQRDAITKRLVVKDTAGVEGAWRWLSPTRVDYRPKDKWPMGDTVTVTGSIQSMPIGSTWGAGTLSDVGFKVTSDLEAVYDASKREVTVTEGGKTIRTMKADGGKKGFESLSGSMVVLGKSETVRMTSCSVGISCTPGAANYYDEQINHAVQISTSGTYLHAAPWDTQLGKVDSSHGCIHLSDEDARWFYSKAIPGNLVTLQGTNNPVEVTNGEGDWNLSWQQWIAPTS